VDLIQTFGAYGWIFVPIGLFLGLLGYRVYRISLFLVGLFTGLALGTWIGSNTDNSQLYLILGLVIGVVLGLISFFLARLSFFVLGTAGGFVLSYSIIERTGLNIGGTEEFILMSAAALLGGVLTVLLYKFLIIFFTSVVGTFLIYQATIAYFPRNSDNWSWILYTILLLVFIVVQMSGRRHHSNPIEKSRH